MPVESACRLTLEPVILDVQDREKCNCYFLKNLILYYNIMTDKNEKENDIRINQKDQEDQAKRIYFYLGFSLASIIIIGGVGYVFIRLYQYIIKNNQQKKIITKDFNCPKVNWETVDNIPETTTGCHCYFDKSDNILGCTDIHNKKYNKLL